jgi:uncharacterized membrane protein YcaP (DUF421 family)
LSFRAKSARGARYSAPIRPFSLGTSRAPQNADDALRGSARPRFEDRAVLTPDLPVWELMLRASVVYVALLVMVRVTGKRSVGQFTPFDMVLLILLGTAVQNSLIGDDLSLSGGLILAATLIALNYLVGWITARSERLHAWIEGRPVQLARDGVVFEDRLRRECLSRVDFDEAMRRNQLQRDDQIESAWLETDGSITLLPRTPESP